MVFPKRRWVLTAGATLLAAGAPRNSSAEAPRDLSAGAPRDLSAGAPRDLSAGAPPDLSPRAPRARLARGMPDAAEVLKELDPPQPPPDGVFLDAGGGEHRLAEFKGHGMVINFWATWCQPCIEEMPSLAALAKTLAPFDIAVLPVSSDRGGAPTVAAWFEQHEVTGLPVLTDPHAALARAFGGDGIPTTHVIARDGLEKARFLGSADWSSAATAALIRTLVEG